MESCLPYALLFVGVFAGALVSGFAGFAFSAVAGAFLLHILPASEAVPLMMACSVVVQGASLLLLRSTMRWRASFSYIVGGALGVPPALYLLQHADTTILRVGFGMFLATYAVCMLVRPTFAYLQGVQSRLRDVAVGFAGGVVGGLTAMPGALPTIWCDLRGLAKDHQRGLVQPFIATMQVVALLALISVGGFSSGTWLHLGLAMPALLAGSVIGIALFGRVNHTTFRRVTLVFLFVGGIALAV
jgi:uncharacterized membrane protein YfcA